ncbi:hypothetical protein ACM55M_04590 [Flavobacterium sp. ZT3R25]|uniref:hypothetical protein n=1 Tax=Flavobacterium galactosi TaxID=3398735 RepID=UPI003A8942C9
MRKIFFTLFISLLSTTTFYSQKKPTKTIQQQANEYKIWFEKLNVYQKRDAARNLVLKLNNMPPEYKGIWLAVLKDTDEKTKPTSMSLENIEKGIIKITKINIEAHFFDPKQDSLVSIKIIEKISNKDWALKENTVIQKKIDSITIVLSEFKKERLNLKKSIPENFVYEETKNDTLYNAYFRIKELERKIPSLTTELVHYPDDFLKGISDDYHKINWDDEKPYKFLVEVISFPNDGLDNIPEAHYFVGNYKQGKEFSIDMNQYGSRMMPSQDLDINLIEKDYRDNEKLSAKQVAYKHFYTYYD